MIKQTKHEEIREIDRETALTLSTWNLIEANIRKASGDYLEESLGFSSETRPSRQEIVDYDKKFGKSSDYYNIWNQGKTHHVDLYRDRLRRDGFKYLRKSFIEGSALEEWYKLNHGAKRE